MERNEKCKEIEKLRRNLSKVELIFSKFFSFGLDRVSISIIKLSPCPKYFPISSQVLSPINANISRSKIKFYKSKYKNRRIFLGYCGYKNFGWYCTKVNGCIIIAINNNFNSKHKGKMLHKVL